jgi:hypothetical protein
MSSPLPFSAGSQLAFGGEYDEGAAENPNMSPSSPVVDCETGAAAVAAVAPTSPTSCIKSCSTFQLEDKTTYSLYSSVGRVTEYGLRLLSYFHITTLQIM